MQTEASSPCSGLSAAGDVTGHGGAATLHENTSQDQVYHPEEAGFLRKHTAVIQTVAWTLFVALKQNETGSVCTFLTVPQQLNLNGSEQETPAMHKPSQAPAHLQRASGL